MIEDVVRGMQDFHRIPHETSIRYMYAHMYVCMHVCMYVCMYVCM